MKKTQATKSKTTQPATHVRELTKLRKTVRELTRERDLYRREWQKAMEEVVPLVMTKAEADLIRRDKVTLDGVLKEIEPMLRKNKTA
jgi:flagellar biosynthesis GTPase FlhF